MIRRQLNFLFVVFVVAVCRVASAAPSQPNVILIMTDDQGYGDLGMHGNTMLKTPRLDRLARESVRMTDFHVNPTCAETRAALMTGRYSCRTGIWHTVNGRSLLRPDELTMAEAFAHSGYATGMFGKWHLGDNYPLLPHQRGFQETLFHGGGGIGQTPDVWGNDYFDDTYFRKGQPELQQGYCTDVFFDASLEFIKRHRDRRFFCYLATNAAHSPFRVPQKYAQPYIDQGVPQPMANFYGMIANIDENVGKLLDKLTEWKLADNTLVIFMTDNGTAAGVYHLKGKQGKGAAPKWTGFNGGLRATKASQYEGGHRVPFFVRWPAGNILGGREVSTLAAQFDLLPTLIDLCHLRLPRSVKFDGTSLQSIWQTEAVPTTLQNRTLFVQSQRVDQPIKWRRCAVMQQQWRLVDGVELYNLEADRGQTQDIAAQHPDLVAELRTRYEAWWASVSSRFAEAVPIELGAAVTQAVTLTAHDWHATEGNEVPWNQQLIAADPAANGYWNVNVQQPGRYQFILRARPEGIPFAFAAGTARLEIAGQSTQWKSIAAGADAVTFAATLPAGPTQLQTWVTGPRSRAMGNGKQKLRGAFFVEVKRL